ncbi:XRE family transcriptional regulator [Acidisoma silvae]|uniref:XRE family transcriptional regulator n=2 Tax=Acidisoma silvae TaxID=2802396 RepID=A0A963YNZ2_9PROT|nr:XRE family transcriptional regulator [Acidisoma silvae]
MTTKLHAPGIGSSFTDFLEEESIRDDVMGVAAKRVIAWEFERLMKESKVTKSALASRLHTSRSQVDRLLDPSNVKVQLDTLAKAADVLGYRLKIGFERG